MPEKDLRVELLSMTPNALELLYASFRQCYHAGFVADMWPRLLNGEIEKKSSQLLFPRFLSPAMTAPLSM